MNLTRLSDINALACCCDLPVPPEPSLDWASITVAICGHTLPTHGDLPSGAQDIRYRDKTDTYQSDTVGTGYSDDRDGTRVNSITWDSSSKSCVSDAPESFDQTTIEDDSTPGETVTSTYGYQFGTGTTNTEYSSVEYSDPSATDVPLTTEAITSIPSGTGYWVPFMAPDSTWNFASPATYSRTTAAGTTTTVESVTYSTEATADFSGLTYAADGDAFPLENAWYGPGYGRKARYTIAAPADWAGIYEVEWDEVLASEDWWAWYDAGMSGTEPTVTPTLVTARQWIWDRIAAESPEYEILPPSSVNHTIRLANFRVTGWRSCRLGEFPEYFGDQVAIPTP